MVTCSIAQGSQLLFTDKPSVEGSGRTAVESNNEPPAQPFVQESSGLQCKSSPELGALIKKETESILNRRRATKPKPKLSFESELTFSPKLNSLSLKLAKSKATVTERIRQGYECRIQVLEEQLDQPFTFQPSINEQSSKIAQRLSKDFWTRQQLHLNKRRKFLEQGLSKLQIKTNTEDYQRQQEIEDEYDGKGENLEMPRTNAKGLSKLKRRRKELIEPNLTPNVLSPAPLSEGNKSSSVESQSPELERLRRDVDRLQRLSKSMDYATKTRTQHDAKQGIADKNNNFESSRRTIDFLQNRQKNKADIQKTKENRYHSLSPLHNEAKQQEIRNQRTRTQSYPYQGYSLGANHVSTETFLEARKAAEQAMRDKKVFICVGPYGVLRSCMRRRGWVEKQFKTDIAYRNAATSERQRTDSDQSDDDSCNGDDIPGCSYQDAPLAPLDEGQPSSKHLTSTSSSAHVTDAQDPFTPDRTTTDFGVLGVPCARDDDGDKPSVHSDNSTVDDFQYWIMSRIVRNCVPTFIWTCKRDDIDFKCLQKDQIVNHYIKAGSFTTKAGLCVNLRNLPWFEEHSPNLFFPRCHRLSSEDEKLNFIDDFRMTAALCILKIVLVQCGSKEELQPPPSPLTDESKALPEISPRQNSPSPRAFQEPAVTSSAVIPAKAIVLAKRACTNLLRCKNHDDIEEPHLDESSVLSQLAWDELIGYYYQLTHHNGFLAQAAAHYEECKALLEKAKPIFPQMHIDGIRNIWIVKPGAKSRGRGIVIMDKLHDILQLVSSNVSRRENRLVIQKYIERPLLIYNTKFDIRQWYLVTDWNPLTIWFYQKCYLRFCGQEFTFDKFDPQYHLANNSIQKNFKNGQRSHLLPQNNMWTCDRFKEYLSCVGKERVWADVIYPNMKRDIIYALECCQDDLEYRKNSFELYGADFMLDEAYHPWLIEINCSPAMGASTVVTERLCAQVIDDTLKVVIDRRDNKNCDTGHFELIHKQQYITVPPYIGSSLAVEGEAIKKPISQVQHQNTTKTVKQAKSKDLKPPVEMLENALNDNKVELKIFEPHILKHKTSEAKGCDATGHEAKVHSAKGQENENDENEENGILTGRISAQYFTRQLCLTTTLPRTAPEPVRLPYNRPRYLTRKAPELTDVDNRILSEFKGNDIQSGPSKGGTLQESQPFRKVPAYHLTKSSLEFPSGAFKDPHTVTTTRNKKNGLHLSGHLGKTVRTCRGIARQTKSIRRNVPLLGSASKALAAIAIRPSKSLP